MKHDSHVKEAAKAPQLADRTTNPKSDVNHGEGNPESAARFDKAEQEFVASKRGQQKIREAGNVSPQEQAELEEAERITRSPPIGSPKVTPPKDGQR
jgi:hypothetical protein